MYFHYFVIISPWKMAGPFIWTNLNPLLPRMLCAKFGWYWLSGSGKEVFLNFVYVFSLFRNYLPLEKAGPFIWKNLNPLHPRMLCAQFGWNWPSGSREEDENVNSLRRRQRRQRRTTDKFWSEKLTWAFGSGELKTEIQLYNLYTCLIYMFIHV